MNKQEAIINFETFTPAWWAKGVHIQTVAASFNDVAPVNCKRIEINTPDNDFLELDILDLKNNRPVVALFHGLEGSSERHYIRNLMNDLQKEGYSSVALNFRGCGSRLNRQKRMYHSGETQDYATLFEWMKTEFSGRAIFAVGFSLGGNALVKSLGEEKENHRVERAVAVSPPYDLAKGSAKMDQGFNRVYQQRFMKTLVEKADQKRKIFPGIPEFTGRSVYDFDDQVTAPVHGFKNADDYYTQCSSGQFYEHVQKPLLIIHSKDDSLCPLEFAPHQIFESNPYIHTLFTETGGHVGFISSPRGWLNQTIIKWLNA